MARTRKTTKDRPRKKPAVPEVVKETSREEMIPFDPLRRYLQEIGKFGILSEDEERALAIRYRDQGDRDAALKLVVSNLRLAVKIALEYHRYWTTNLLDLIQEGNVGLMQAVARFDPYRGTRFTTYASFWIRAYILKFIMDNWRLVKIGTTQAQRRLFFDLNKEKQRLEQMGFDPVPKLVAQRLSVKPEEVVEMDQRMEMPDVSLDARVDADTSATLGDLIPGHATPPDEELGQHEFQRLLGQKLSEFRQGLSAREQDIFEQRMIAEEPLTLREIGERYAISPERVRQIEAEILEKARTFLRKEIPDLDVYKGEIFYQGE